jgi:hypothetical protein
MVETLGEAYRLGWRATASCIWSGPNPKSRHGRVRTECDTTAELDMKTLLWTRGANFPLKLLESRLRCPQCGKLGVTVLFAVPNQPKSQAIRAAE